MHMIDDAPSISTRMVKQAEAQRLANTYVTSQISPSLFVADRASYHETHNTWLLMICCADGPLHTIEVERQSGQVVPLTPQQICLVRERAAMAAARGCHRLPVDADGYVLAEYARRRASWYLDANLSMFFCATEPVFVPGASPLWQMTILFQQYDIGPFTMGLIDVDAYTGEPLPLTDAELTQIRERTSAIIRHQTPTPTAG